MQEILFRNISPLPLERVKNLIALIFICLALISCLLPEKFTCNIQIHADGSYSVVYDGTIVDFRVLEGINAGSFEGSSILEVGLEDGGITVKIIGVNSETSNSLIERGYKIDGTVIITSAIPMVGDTDLKITKKGKQVVIKTHV